MKKKLWIQLLTLALMFFVGGFSNAHAMERGSSFVLKQGQTVKITKVESVVSTYQVKLDEGETFDQTYYDNTELTRSYAGVMGRSLSGNFNLQNGYSALLTAVDGDIVVELGVGYVAEDSSIPALERMQVEPGDAYQLDYPDKQGIIYYGLPLGATGHLENVINPTTVDVVDWSNEDLDWFAPIVTKARSGYHVIANTGDLPMTVGLIPTYERTITKQ